MPEYVAAIPDDTVIAPPHLYSTATYLAVFTKAGRFVLQGNYAHTRSKLWCSAKPYWTNASSSRWWSSRSRRGKLQPRLQSNVSMMQTPLLIIPLKIGCSKTAAAYWTGGGDWLQTIARGLRKEKRNHKHVEQTAARVSAKCGDLAGKINIFI